MSEDNQGILLNPYQDGFIYDPFKFKFMKSAWATGKTRCLITAGIKESLKYKDNLGVIFRKEYTDLKDSTCVDYESYTGRKISSKRDIRYSNGSRTLFRHLEELNNLQNMNLGWFGIEQGEELDTDTEFFTLFGRLRRENSSRRGYIISNAKGKNWIYKLKKRGIYNPRTKERLDKHWSATTFDNKHNLTQDYLDSLEALKLAKPALYRRMVLNSDEEDDTVDLVMDSGSVDRAINRVLDRHMSLRRCVICDPARFGDDKTVIYVFENNAIIHKEVYSKKDTMWTAGVLIRTARKYGCNTIGVDAIGLGAGIVDRLREVVKKDGGIRIWGINSASKSNFPDKYYNLRAEMYDTASDKFKDDKVSIDNDDKLVEQLTSIKYKTIKSNGKLQIEAKEDVKKRLLESPDHADGCVMGLWLVDYCDPVVVRDGYMMSNNNSGPLNADTV